MTSAQEEKNMSTFSRSFRVTMQDRSLVAANWTQAVEVIERMGDLIKEDGTAILRCEWLAGVDFIRDPSKRYVDTSIRVNGSGGLEEVRKHIADAVLSFGQVSCIYVPVATLVITFTMSAPKEKLGVALPGMAAAVAIWQGFRDSIQVQIGA